MDVKKLSLNESSLKNKNNFDDITDKIKFVTRGIAEIKHILVDDILPTKSGKYRYTISKTYN